MHLRLLAVMLMFAMCAGNVSGTTYPQTCATGYTAQNLYSGTKDASGGATININRWGCKCDTAESWDDNDEVGTGCQYTSTDSGQNLQFSKAVIYYRFQAAVDASTLTADNMASATQKIEDEYELHQSERARPVVTRKKKLKLIGEIENLHAGGDHGGECFDGVHSQGKCRDCNDNEAKRVRNECEDWTLGEGCEWLNDYSDYDNLMQSAQSKTLRQYIEEGVAEYCGANKMSRRRNSDSFAEDRRDLSSYGWPTDFMTPDSRAYGLAVNAQFRDGSVGATDGKSTSKIRIALQIQVCGCKVVARMTSNPDPDETWCSGNINAVLMDKVLRKASAVMRFEKMKQLLATDTCQNQALGTQRRA